MIQDVCGCEPGDSHGGPAGRGGRGEADDRVPACARLRTFKAIAKNAWTYGGVERNVRVPTLNQIALNWTESSVEQTTAGKQPVRLDVNKRCSMLDGVRFDRRTGPGKMSIAFLHLFQRSLRNSKLSICSPARSNRPLQVNHPPTFA